MNRSRFTLTAIAFLYFFAASTQASTVYFLPGDAYFRTYLTEDFLDRQSVEEPITFQYAPTTPYFCGYVGTSRLKFANQKGELLQQLRLAYHVIRSLYPKEAILHQKYKPIKHEDGSFELQKIGEPSITESNRLHVFIYNLNFDLTNHQLLHLYNENWKTECHVDDRDPHEIVVGNDIRDESLERGKEVHPLQVQKIGSPKEQAHLVPAGELMFVIVPDKKWLEHIARRKVVEPKVELNKNSKRPQKPEIYILKPDGLYFRSLEGDRWSDEEKITYDLLSKPKPGFF